MTKGAENPAPFTPNCSNLTSLNVSTMDSRLILLVSSSSHLKDKMCKVSIIEKSSFSPQNPKCSDSCGRMTVIGNAEQMVSLKPEH